MNLDNFYDVVVIGGGPAGLTAALYLARARYRVIVLEKENFGGQITITAEVVNYPGVGRTNGKELTETMRKQAENFGAEFKIATANKIEVDGNIKKVHTDKGIFNSFGILIATGAHPRMVGFKGESEYKGRGVAYCATCDGEFFTGKEIYVVGGGFAAAEEAVFLTKYGKHVTILIRGNDFSCAASVADSARNNPKITVLTNTSVDAVIGDDSGLKAIRTKDKHTGEITEHRDDNGIGVFVFAGYEPATDVLKGVVDLDEKGYVVTDRSGQTSAKGVYAAGDVCIKRLRQVVTAVGDGAAAATELERVCAAMQKATGLTPKRPTVSAPQKSQAQEAPKESSPAQNDKGALFDDAIKEQLNAVFTRMERPLLLELGLDDRPVSSELEAYMNELASLTDKLKVKKVAFEEGEAPFVRICDESGKATGLAFHGTPGGHEFTSFILGLYNAAGPGQPIDADIKAAIKAISKKVDIKILVSLTCTMCPDLVIAAQRIAAENPNVSAEVYDINHFSALKDKYRVMSVPCLVLNDTKVTFGKKNIQQLLDIIAAL